MDVSVPAGKCLAQNARLTPQISGAVECEQRSDLAAVEGSHVLSCTQQREDWTKTGLDAVRKALEFKTHSADLTDGSSLREMGWTNCFAGPFLVQSTRSERLNHLGWTQSVTAVACGR